MFSQYSWGDFIKFILALAIPYYGYVLIRYYREDIREWWVNRRGQKAKPAANREPVIEEDVTTPLFAVSDYRQPAVSSAPAATNAPGPEVVFADPHLEGPALVETEVPAFSLPLTGEVINTVEQSLEELTSAAARLTKNEDGALVADDPDDRAATRLASIINNQQGRTAFADISFTR